MVVQFPHQLFQECGQDVIQRLVTDGGVELLKRLGCRLSNLLQRVTQGLPDSRNQGLREHQHLENKRGALGVDRERKKGEGL